MTAATIWVFEFILLVPYAALCLRLSLGRAYRRIPAYAALVGVAFLGILISTLLTPGFTALQGMIAMFIVSLMAWAGRRLVPPVPVAGVTEDEDERLAGLTPAE